MKRDKIVIGISQGDINGIGYEVIIKTLMEPRILEMCTPIVYGSPKVAAYHKKALNIETFNFNHIRTAGEADSRKANIINCMDDNTRVELGKSSEMAGEASYLALEKAVEDLKNGDIDALITAPINKDNIQSEKFNFPGHTEYLALEKAVEDLKNGEIDALITAPINKDNIQSEKFNFPGHTEYLAEQFKTRDYVMLMVSESMKVGVVVGHVPMSEVPSKITKGAIINKLRIINQSLERDFFIKRPRIAVLGLNPHAGDNGLLGREELDIIIPAIQRAKDEGIIAIGPYPADGFFGSGDFSKFDAILAMYHDQGLIPFKMASFDRGVNYTAGLPIIRTSPAHGTAFDIAGEDKATPDSFREALYLAIDIHKNRTLYKEITKNPLRKYEINQGQVDESIDFEAIDEGN